MGVECGGISGVMMVGGVIVRSSWAGVAGFARARLRASGERFGAGGSRVRVLVVVCGVLVGLVSGACSAQA